MLKRKTSAVEENAFIGYAKTKSFQAINIFITERTSVSWTEKMILALVNMMVELNSEDYENVTQVIEVLDALKNRLPLGMHSKMSEVCKALGSKICSMAFNRWSHVHAATEALNILKEKFPDEFHQLRCEIGTFSQIIVKEIRSLCHSDSTLNEFAKKILVMFLNFGFPLEGVADDDGCNSILYIMTFYRFPVNNLKKVVDGIPDERKTFAYREIIRCLWDLSDKEYVVSVCRELIDNNPKIIWVPMKTHFRILKEKEQLKEPIVNCMLDVIIRHDLADELKKYCNIFSNEKLYEKIFYVFNSLEKLAFYLKKNSSFFERLPLKKLKTIEWLIEKCLRSSIDYDQKSKIVYFLFVHITQLGLIDNLEDAFKNLKEEQYKTVFGKILDTLKQQPLNFTKHYKILTKSIQILQEYGIVYWEQYGTLLATSVLGIMTMHFRFNEINDIVKSASLEDKTKAYEQILIGFESFICSKIEKNKDYLNITTLLLNSGKENATRTLMHIAKSSSNNFDFEYIENYICENELSNAEYIFECIEYVKNLIKETRAKKSFEDSAMGNPYYFQNKKRKKDHDDELYEQKIFDIGF